LKPGAKLTIGVLYQEGLKEYDFGPGHPFRGDRYVNFHRFLRQNLAEDDVYRVLEAAPASDGDLRLICSDDYIRFTGEYYRRANLGDSFSGEFFRYHSSDNLPIGRPGKLEEAARLVVGQAREAADLVWQGRFHKVVSIGGGLHHAKPSSGEGFCLYNDVAFAALYLLKEYKLERVAVLDTDAHAGNGTAAYFYRDRRVLFIDLHQDPSGLYPGTGFANQIGEGEGRGFTVNIPLPPGAGDASYRLAFESIVEPLVAEFRPQIIIRNGGSDPHFADGLTDLGLTLGGFRMIGEKTRRLAEFCGGREIDLIASGYNEAVLPPAWLALITSLAGMEMEIAEPVPGSPPPDPLSSTARVISEVRGNLKDYWPSLR
jgi:acetoin utilization protein AcuC